MWHALLLAQGVAIGGCTREVDPRDGVTEYYDIVTAPFSVQIVATSDQCDTLADVGFSCGYWRQVPEGCEPSTCLEEVELLPEGRVLRPSPEVDLLQPIWAEVIGAPEQIRITNCHGTVTIEVPSDQTDPELTKLGVMLGGDIVGSWGGSALDDRAVLVQVSFPSGYRARRFDDPYGETLVCRAEPDEETVVVAADSWDRLKQFSSSGVVYSSTVDDATRSQVTLAAGGMAMSTDPMYSARRDSDGWWWIPTGGRYQTSRRRLDLSLDGGTSVYQGLDVEVGISGSGNEVSLHAEQQLFKSPPEVSVDLDGMVGGIASLQLELDDAVWVATVPTPGLDELFSPIPRSMSQQYRIPGVTFVSPGSEVWTTDVGLTISGDAFIAPRFAE